MSGAGADSTLGLLQCLRRVKGSRSSDESREREGNLLQYAGQDARGARIVATTGRQHCGFPLRMRSAAFSSAYGRLRLMRTCSKG